MACAILVEGIMRNICEIILNLDQWFRRCRLKIFLVYSSGGPFVPWSLTIREVLEGALQETFQ